MVSFERELELASGLARQAGDEALTARHEGRVRPGTKAGGEIVTTADVRADEIIRTGLAEAFGADALWTEETPGRPATAQGRMWVVDPLDGTGDFVSGGDAFSVSIGLAVDGRPLLGVVYNPSRAQLVTGGAGIGAGLNGEAAGPSGRTELAGARVTCSPREERALADAFERAAVGVALDPVASMAYKLARVAVGLDDATLTLRGRKPWGVCAGVAIACAAGATVELLGGGPIRIDPREDRQPDGFVAAAPVLAGALARIVLPARPDRPS
ncbi:MAG: monophosphatase [Solirubrobacteraceae bacterium]|nr:monophosphatase [Solirubrobacteraceae bacterium]